MGTLNASLGLISIAWSIPMCSTGNGARDDPSRCLATSTAHAVRRGWRLIQERAVEPYQAARGCSSNTGRCGENWRWRWGACICCDRATQTGRCCGNQRRPNMRPRCRTLRRNARSGTTGSIASLQFALLLRLYTISLLG
jgi:hypothetical protein